MSRIGIVGGGMLGMTLGWNLAKAGHNVKIFEGAPRCGGLAGPWELGDVVWDRHYHVTLASDLAVLELLRELDLESELRWTRPGTGFFVDGKLYPFSGALDYLRFPALNPVQKLRLGATIMHASRITDWRPLEKLTAVEWLTRLSRARHGRAHMASAAASEARSVRRARFGCVHLGDHRPHVRRSRRPATRAVRLCFRRVR